MTYLDRWMKVGAAKYSEIKDGHEYILLPVMRQRSRTGRAGVPG